MKKTAWITGIMVIAAAVVGAALIGCPNPSKTAADVSAGIACVAAHWGQSAEQVAAACFNNELALAIDAIAEYEYLMQSRGAPPTPTYTKDARVIQLVLMKRSAATATDAAVAAVQ